MGASFHSAKLLPIDGGERNNNLRRRNRSDEKDAEKSIKVSSVEDRKLGTVSQRDTSCQYHYQRVPQDFAKPRSSTPLVPTAPNRYIKRAPFSTDFIWRVFPAGSGGGKYETKSVATFPKAFVLVNFWNCQNQKFSSDGGGGYLVSTRTPARLRYPRHVH